MEYLTLSFSKAKYNAMIGEVEVVSRKMREEILEIVLWGI
jgi:hypothetical protein